jgi:hypothetical protein
MSEFSGARRFLSGAAGAPRPARSGGVIRELVAPGGW